MLNILVNAYAVAPNWGSEQGMGWNWVVHIARYCNVYVITEGEWRDEIEKALPLLPQKDNLHFHYLPVSERVRRMCWNQGDWRFYFHYSIWQTRALELARRIVEEQDIDIVHQLNMVGFREPGLLWKIKDIPYVLGPIAGNSAINLSFFKDEAFAVRVKYFVKNILNNIQFRYSCRVVHAIRNAKVVITPMADMAEDIRKIYSKEVCIIPESGLESRSAKIKRKKSADAELNILWVGRMIVSKQLALALETIAHLRNKANVKIHIVGFGMNGEEDKYKKLAGDLGIEQYCIWYGRVDNAKVKEMMGNMDILFFTSILEVTSTVIPEAIQAGLPVLCHDICGFGHLVDESIGWRIPMISPRDSVNEFSKIIDSICDNPDLLGEHSYGFEKVSETLTFDSKARKLVEIYTKLHQ